MAATAHSGWAWPSEICAEHRRPSTMPGSFLHESEFSLGDDNNGIRSEESSKSSFSPQPTKTYSTQSTKKERKPKRWLPRTCRICLETVMPKFHSPSENLPDILQPTPTVTYESEDPASGRLLRPCKCKGSSKYVHEGCLQQWRHADPEYGNRNYWHCPTCGFRYRLQRMTWARWISSTASQIALTVAIFFLAMFLFGFIADPIINLYLDPYSTISSATKFGGRVEPILTDDEVPSWPEHFLKGLASLGLLSFVKFLFTLSPWQWWNVRSSGIMNGGGRAGNTGRNRLVNISWIVVLVGVGTFLWASVHLIDSLCG